MNYIKKILFTGAMAMSIASCTDDLELTPRYEVTSATVYQDFSNYKSILAKIYAGYALTGQAGPDGEPDVSGFDEGKSNYIRAYWSLQELPTDEAVIAWNDGTLFDLHDMDWSSSNEYIRMMYDRIYFQIALCNEFLRNTTDARLSENGITGANLEEAKAYRAEARLLRAMSYWHALDLFGNVPFVTEEDPVGAFFPEQISRTDLFDFVESELLAVEPELVDARQNEYARADKAVAWTVLAKLFLNAEVYTGQNRYTDAVAYSKKVIDAGYSLVPDYQDLFLADNHTSRQEVILPVAFDGQSTRTWGGTTFLIHGAVGGSMDPSAFGINSGWAGLRTTKEFVNLFPNTGADERAMFYTQGQSLEINNIATFTEGYAVTKFKNVTSAGDAGSDQSGNYPDTDFPMFRLADVYLMYAEAVLRGGVGGDRSTALSYINQLRERAYGSTAGNISDSQLTLNFILSERGRELYWEGHRRTDLIRFNRFTTGDYTWAWKGGVQEGRQVESFRTLYPLPTSDLSANPNLDQNNGY